MGSGIIILDQWQYTNHAAAKLLESGKIDKINGDEMNCAIVPYEYHVFVEGKLFTGGDGRLGYSPTYRLTGDELVEITPRLRVADYEAAKNLLDTLEPKKRKLEVEIYNQLEPKKRMLGIQIEGLQLTIKNHECEEKKLALAIETLSQSEEVAKLDSIKDLIYTLKFNLETVTLHGEGRQIKETFDIVDKLFNTFNEDK
jgi:hypothetical protein